MCSSKLLIWVMLDDRAGNNAQTIGVAEALGMDYVVKQISYNSLARLPNFLRGKSLIGVDGSKSSAIDGPWPDIVVAAGRKLAPVARYIRLASGGKARLFHMMWPDCPVGDFEKIFLPQHDQKYAFHDDVFYTIGAANKITPDMLKIEREKWRSKFEYLPGPRAAVLVGGDNKRGKFTLDHAKKFSADLNNFALKNKLSLMVTTSRRTSKEVRSFLSENISVKHYFYDFASAEENPYLGLLSMCDAVVVSGDSVSMCSEACSSGRPVYIYAPEGLIGCKHKAMHQALYQGQYAQTFAPDATILGNYNTLGDAGTIARAIKS